ncbi:bromodomain-containing protein 7 isoform X2 [Plutella xylostella]|uniref:bromodomain-containing protein 7 isoform X2 n=1 Tax=Plutella xylostella TaxID=51655 RepID=UPI002032D91C|nr:bromodomain-containing protein 7 isoform X2 [Plutella xylostella]
MEELSCKEEILDLSDLDHSAAEESKEVDEKPKTKKRRRREIDMASQKRRPLSRLLEQLLRNLEKRDPNQFFAWPVNDNFAPNYSNIIKKPMDFSSMKQKIDDNEYRSLNCFISDFKLMCNNAMKYNKPGTVYHKAARRLLHQGLKQLTPHKLRPLGNILTYMYEIPIRELGFDIGKMDVHKVLKRSSPIKSGGSEAEAASDGGEAREGGDRVKLKMERAREQHRRRLAKKAFPRMDSTGRTTLCVATHTVEGGGDDKPLTLGACLPRLQHGTGSLHTVREDRRNLVKGVRPLHYGPYSSYAPSYDGTFATLTKEESHLLYHTLASETGAGPESTLRFAPDSPWAALYDMDALFPDKKVEEDQTPTVKEDDISKVKVDIEQLRSLSSLGIDVDFLNEIEEEVASSQRDYGLGAALARTAELLASLEKQQRDRLSQPPPPHLSFIARPGPAERDAARAAAAALRQMAARVQPKHVVSVASVRKAMGVTLDHLDTPLSVDEFVEEPGEGRDASDPDSRCSLDSKGDRLTALH